MIAWIALLGLLSPAQAEQDAGDQVRKLKVQMEGLQKENEALRTLKNILIDARFAAQVEILEKQAFEDAKTIVRLKNALKVLEGRAARPMVKPPGPKEGFQPPEEDPMEAIQIRLEFVDSENKFVVIAIGREAGVLPGFRFDIFREIIDGGSPSAIREDLGVGVVEKYLDSRETISKLNIIEGDVTKMRQGDHAVAYRKLPPRPKGDVVKVKPPSNHLGIYKITGRSDTGADAGFVITYGSDDGAHQTDVLYVYKDSRLKAKLRLDTVHSRFSVASVIDGTQVQAPKIGDHVLKQELKNTVIGRVRINDDQRGILIDVGGQNHGVRAGDLFEVRRRGRKVGVIIVSTADLYYAYAKPIGETKRGDIKLGDHVERIYLK